MLKHLYWRWCSRFNTKAENAALQPRCGGPQTAVQHLTVSPDAAKVPVEREHLCKHITLEKNISDPGTCWVAPFGWRSRCGEWSAFPFKFSLFCWPLTQHLSCLLWKSMCSCCFFAFKKQKTSNLTLPDSAQRNFLFFFEWTLAK